MKKVERKVMTFLEAGEVYVGFLQEIGGKDRDVESFWDLFWRFQYEVVHLTCYLGLEPYTPAADMPFPADVVLVYEAVCNLNAFSGSVTQEDTRDLLDCYDRLAKIGLLDENPLCPSPGSPELRTLQVLKAAHARRSPKRHGKPYALLFSEAWAILEPELEPNTRLAYEGAWFALAQHLAPQPKAHSKAGNIPVPLDPRVLAKALLAVRAEKGDTYSKASWDTFLGGIGGSFKRLHDWGNIPSNPMPRVRHFLEEWAPHPSESA